MSHIKLLDTDLINKIAAGEVVERPVSVVKELVENSIDAKANAITIEIKDGGVSLVQITDNGIGIDKNEAKTAFLKHSTSKIRNIDDLENVMSLGFRGEALSSIASVAQVEMLTKTKTSEMGFCLEVNGGEFVREQDVAAANGTIISVRNLFYNIPARRKFLKKTATESGYISDVITKIALGNPHISFNYINNGSKLIRTKGDGDLKSTIYQIYGKETASCLLPIDYLGENVHVTGYICKPEMYRSNRSYEHMFINGRHIKSEIVSSATEQTLKTMLPIGKFPVFFLFIKIHPSLIDINVHPTKLEVRFWNDEKILEIVSAAVKKAFSGQNLIPAASWQKDDYLTKPIQVSETTESSSAKSSVSKYADIINSVYANKPIPKDSSDVSEQTFTPNPYNEIYEEQAGLLIEDNLDEVNSIECNNIPVEKDDTIKNLKADSSYQAEKTNSKPQIFIDYKIVGQLFNTYWIIEQGSKMYIMDQHAAHERCLYDQLSKKLKEKPDIVSQPILNPYVLTITPKEMSIVDENRDLFEQFGFDIDKFGEKEIAIRAVPYLLKDTEDVNFFLEILDKLSKIETAVSNIYDVKTDAIASIACKAAVKGNDKLSYTEAKELISQVTKLENPFTCPHGRPTIIEIPKYELEKRFKRVM
ncbi:MAG: DNA mismatch repair endonuclease MutL [Defluviitaleaceae bacterium]|nr:DNA mismatch repair endonuclease MutL [Defluviitaleaceae bacterium]